MRRATLSRASPRSPSSISPPSDTRNGSSNAGSTSMPGCSFRQCCRAWTRAGSAMSRRRALICGNPQHRGARWSDRRRTPAGSLRIHRRAFPRVAQQLALCVKSHEPLPVGRARAEVAGIRLRQGRRPARIHRQVTIISTPRHRKRLNGHYVSSVATYAQPFFERLREVTRNSPFWGPRSAMTGRRVQDTGRTARSA